MNELEAKNVQSVFRLAQQSGGTTRKIFFFLHAAKNHFSRQGKVRLYINACEKHRFSQAAENPLDEQKKSLPPPTRAATHLRSI